MNFGSTTGKLGSGTIWYPAASYLDSRDGSLYLMGYSSGFYWSCTPGSSRAYYLYFNYDGHVSLSNYYYRAYGLSVRCLRE